MLNNKSKIKHRARRFFTQRACFSAVADCISTISGASLFQSRVTTLPAKLKTCSDLEDAAGMAKMTLKIGARMNNGLQKIIEKSVHCKVKIPNQNKTLTSALTYCPTVETDLMELDLYFVGTRWGKVFFLDSKGSLRHY